MNTQLAKICTVDNLIKTYERLGYMLFTNDINDYNLNVCTIRANNQTAGSFDDLEILFWKYKGNWTIVTHSATADPSDLSLITMKNALGCAILKPGQYLNSHKLGLHRGKYEALVQAKPITVIRDFDRDNTLDYYMDTIGLDKVIKPNNNYGATTKYYKGADVVFIEDTGIFGINHHMASFIRILESVGLYSEGCCVHNVATEYKEYINIIKEAVAIYGNQFTTTLLTEEQIMKSI